MGVKMINTTLGALKFNGFGEHNQIIKVTIKEQWNQHSVLMILIGMDDEGARAERGRFCVDRPVTLTQHIEGKQTIVFAGLINQARQYQQADVWYAEITADSYSSQLDRKKKNRSFQKESRSYGELLRYLLDEYDDADFLWNKQDQLINQFLLQYEETDWEFLKRILSIGGLFAYSEIRMRGVKLFIGLTVGRAVHYLEGPIKYNEKQRFHTTRKQQEDMISNEMEYEVLGITEPMQLGETAIFLGHEWIVARKYSCLKDGEWSYDYLLKPESSCVMKPIANPYFNGLAINGSVIAAKGDMVQLKLDTDIVNEEIECWHQKPVYYAGGKMGYHGAPELGDRMQLYLSGKDESNRYIIAAADSGTDKMMEMVMSGIEPDDGSTAAQEPVLADYKNWYTPGGVGIRLNESELTLSTAGQSSKICLRDRMIELQSKGDIHLYTEEIVGAAKKISLDAKEYIWVHSGGSDLLLTECELQIKAPELELKSPLNEACDIPDPDQVKTLLAAYAEEAGKRMTFYEEDGSLKRWKDDASEKEKNIIRAMDEIYQVMGIDEDSGYEFEVEYKQYSLKDIQDQRKKDEALINFAGAIPGVGTYLSILAQLVYDDTYDNGLRESLEAILDGNSYNAFMKLKVYLISKIYPYFDLDDAFMIIDGAVASELAAGSIASPDDSADSNLVVNYLPYMGRGENYTGNTEYYIKDKDIEIKVSVKLNNSYVGQYVIYSNYNAELDSYEITTFWYYSNK